MSEKDAKATQKAQEAEGAEKSAQSKGDNPHTTVDLTPYIERNQEEGGVKSFAIDAHDRNTSNNPDHESTFTVPVLVKRVNSEELLPRPFKSTTSLLLTSYLCLFCCCLPAAYAVQYAWEAKTQRNAGVYTSAIKKAKKSLFFIKLALGVGTALWIFGGVMLALQFTGKLKD